MSLREYARTPLLLALLIVLPAYFVGVFTRITPSSSIPITVGGESLVTELNVLVGALMTPLASALVGGLVGLFVVQNAKDADSRLVLCGYKPHELVVSRLGMLGVSGLTVTLISVVVLSFSLEPTHMLLFVGMVFATAVTYGMVGVIAGITLNRLAGVYVMLFAPIVDIVLFQNPVASDSAPWFVVLPGHFVTTTAMEAAFASSVTTGHVLASIAYLVALIVIGSSIFFALTRRY